MGRPATHPFEPRLGQTLTLTLTLSLSLTLTLPRPLTLTQIFVPMFAILVATLIFGHPPLGLGLGLGQP